MKSINVVNFEGASKKDETVKFYGFGKYIFRMKKTKDERHYYMAKPIALAVWAILAPNKTKEFIETVNSCNARANERLHGVRRRRQA